MILLSAWSRKLRNGKQNAKNYNKWPEVVELLRKEGFRTVQVAENGDEPIGADEFIVGISLNRLVELVRTAQLVLSVDNAIHHIAENEKIPCIVIWGVSDPRIFGYEDQINLLKDERNLRPGRQQFGWWEDVPYREDVFVEPEVVVRAVKNILKPAEV